MVKYKIAEIRQDGDQIGFILEKVTDESDTEMDGFAVWISIEEYEQNFFDSKGNLDKKKLKEFLKEKVKERKEFLKSLRRAKEEKEQVYKDKVEKAKEVKDEEIDYDESEGGAGQ